MGAVFSIIIAYRAIAKPKENSIPEIISFWFAYILTRPVGASFADYFGYDFAKGVFGNQWMSFVGLILFGLTLVSLVHENRKHKELEVA